MVGIATANAALLCQVQTPAGEAISHAALQSSPCFTLHAHSRAMLQVFEQVGWRGYMAGSRQGFCNGAATAAEVALEDEERSGGQYVGHEILPLARSTKRMVLAMTGPDTQQPVAQPTLAYSPAPVR